MHLTESLIARAVRAPSSHNTQPWLFRRGDAQIDLWADRTRALPANDPQDRELVISCGCALMTLRLAVAATQRAYRVDVLPDASQPDWLARLTWRERDASGAEEATLAAFIEQRRTYRKAFAERAVDPAVVAELQAAAETEQAWLRPVTATAVRQQVAELVAAGDHAQWSDPRWRRELAAWMRPRRCGDGLTVPAAAVPITRWIVSRFDMGEKVGAQDQQLAQTAPVLAVLGTATDERRSWLAAGQALVRVLLSACRHGLQASYLNQPVQVATLRPKLGEIVGDGFPQIVLRLGYPQRVLPPAPRRPVNAVLQPLRSL